MFELQLWLLVELLPLFWLTVLPLSLIVVVTGANVYVLPLSLVIVLFVVLVITLELSVLYVFVSLFVVYVVLVFVLLNEPLMFPAGNHFAVKAAGVVPLGVPPVVSSSVTATAGAVQTVPV